jgi:hypothetical protein
MKKAKNLSAWFKRAPPFLRHRFNEPHFKPYVAAIGELMLAWNDLHERLATLFAQAMVNAKVKQSFAVWHNTRADNAKRKLLKAAIGNLDGAELKSRPKVVQEIRWILEKADSLEGLRDDSAHGPLHATPTTILDWNNLLAAGNLLGLKVRPNISFGNTRAIRLSNGTENLLSDFRYAKKRILILRDYAIAISTAWLNPPMPWPDRPALPDPNSNRRNTPKAKRQKQKSPARPPQSSRA